MLAMNAQFFVAHIQYSRWATMANLDAAAKLTNEELNRPMGDSFKGLLGTLVHTFRADRVWLNRLKGNSTAPMIPPGETFTLPDLRAEWIRVLDELESVVGAFSDEDLAVEMHFFSVVKQRDFVVPRWKAILHMVNHASYHRGQITTLLLQQNHVPASTDLIFYYLRDQF